MYRIAHAYRILMMYHVVVLYILRIVTCTAPCIALLCTTVITMHCVMYHIKVTVAIKFFSAMHHTLPFPSEILQHTVGCCIIRRIKYDCIIMYCTIII
jgi:hypothetical protein